MSEYVDDEGRREPRVGRTVSNQPISTGNEAPLPSAAVAVTVILHGFAFFAAFTTPFTTVIPSLAGE